MANQRAASFLTGFGLGAGLMYFFDPITARRRRARVRDKTVHYIHEGRNTIDVVARDLGHRLYGYGAMIRSAFSDDSVPDYILVERVRSRLGRVVSHPHALEVHARDGRVLLSGMILEDEKKDVLLNASMVRGVKGIIDKLQPHKVDENIPALQGGKRRPGIRPELLQHNWSPAARAVMGLSGSALSTYGFLIRGGFFGRVIGSIGVGLTIRALSNTELKMLFGVRERALIKVRKTIQIKAHRDTIFQFWSKFENLAKLMPDVISVKPVSENVYRWSVKGPAGVPVHWDATVTRFIPNQVIAWKTNRNAAVPNLGRIRFSSSEPGVTLVTLDISYRPPAGALGHVIARLFGADPKSKLDEDLMRLKSWFESGHTRLERSVEPRNIIAG